MGYKILGIKLTHDAAVALLDSGELVFSTEIEKINDNPRYSSVSSLSQIETILKTEGVDISEVHSVVIDGWKLGKIYEPFELDVAGYHENDTIILPIAKPSFIASIKILGVDLPCLSYSHVAGHIFGSYMASDFNEEDGYCLVWDGGIKPRLYQIENKMSKITFIKNIHKISGLLYNILGYYAGPYKTDDILYKDASLLSKCKGRRDWPGKIMSWIAKGTVDREVTDLCHIAYEMIEEDTEDGYRQEFNAINEHKFIRYIMDNSAGKKDEDILLTVHSFLGDLTVDSLLSNTERNSNLCFTGGSALNIKWNSRIRNTGHFGKMFVPPFANDSGSALGQACAEHFRATGETKLNWSVYSGPKLIASKIKDSWESREMPINKLAVFMSKNKNTPIVILNDRAEIGPRALGNRSILALPILGNKEILNKIKLIEEWRPVSPICLEEDAKLIFSPGGNDKYMLFDHEALLKEGIESVLHIDGTSRLQTISENDNKVVFDLLSVIKQITGTGLLCNTSANFNGCGFFPSIESVMKWDKVDYIWSDGIFYSRENTYEKNKLEKAVIDVIEKRQTVGRRKYGCGISTDQNSTVLDWLEEAIEECADQLQYLVACKMFIKESKI